MNTSSMSDTLSSSSNMKTLGYGCQISFHRCPGQRYQYIVPTLRSIIFPKTDRRFFKGIPSRDTVPLNTVEKIATYTGFQSHIVGITVSTVHNLTC